MYWNGSILSVRIRKYKVYKILTYEPTPISANLSAEQICQ